MFSVLRTARKSLGKALLALSAVALAACQPSSGPAPSAGANGPVAVALLVPSGSGQASDQLLARSIENAARMAISDLAGVQIDLRVYPTAGQPAQASTAAQQAIADGAQVILGPVFAEEANARRAQAKLLNANLPAFRQSFSTSSGQRTRVRVGPFATAAEAQKAAQQIRRMQLEAVMYQQRG